MKKIFCLFLILIFILALMPGCTQDDPENPDEELPEEDKIDFDGQSFYFSPYLVEGYYPLEGETSSGDKILERYRQLEKDYNCVFECVDMDAQRNDATALITAVASAVDIPDIIDRETRVTYPFFKSGEVLFPIEEISTIDITDGKWGPLYLLQNGKFDGKYYGLFPYEWEFFPEFHGMVLVNNLLIAKLGLVSPYEMQENKTWTWDSFSEQLHSATRTEGEETYLGLSVWDAGSIIEDFMFTAAFSNGAKMIVEKDGVMSFGLTTPEAIAGFDYVSGLRKDNVIKTEPNYDSFKNSTTVYNFTLSHISTGRGEELIPNVMEDYGMLPFPSGPAAPEGNCSAFISYERRLYILSVSENDPEETGIVMNYVFAPLDDTGGWRNTLERQIVHHEEDYDNFIYMVENCGYNYMSQLDAAYGNIADNMRKILSGSMKASAAIASIEELVNDQISKIVFE